MNSATTARGDSCADIIVPGDSHSLTPEAHEDGEEDGGAVVEQVTRLDLAAHARVVPVRTALVALGTHREVVVFVATLVPIATTSHDTSATLVGGNQSRNTNT